MLTEAQLAAEVQISTRQVQRYTAAGMPRQPVGVRGIHAPPDDHPTIREAAKRLAGELAKKRKPATPTKG